MRLLLRLESERKSCAIWYILFCQSPKQSSIIAQTLCATYDGHVFTPEEDLDLLPGRRYAIRVEMQPAQNPEPKKRI
ncbi:MAG: hypothetical protein BECKG1743D_GA0114223_102881 [Candidatus Kentron sp. G]|nr:MAG: hypothetical protein BECKG1743F_GA0114225_102322 [Candidatus Kentron sp. G]VFM99887.1 MAG: hypothetical protein BECKG1743E_GA0114224_102891 [Candidatus Kentron sp. G]VFN01525.1 MAG: hypothetical protein BECKG1743D_GA0114223_102881 [Candidatus Kentron sp. G]